MWQLGSRFTDSSWQPGRARLPKSWRLRKSRDGRPILTCIFPTYFVRSAPHVNHSQSVALGKSAMSKAVFAVLPLLFFLPFARGQAPVPQSPIRDPENLITFTTWDAEIRKVNGHW